MSRLAHLLSHLQQNETDEQRVRSSFLKKLILTFYYGELRIHGRAANAHYPLSDYLLDDRRALLDFSRLSDDIKTRFKEWLFSYYQQHLSYHFQKPYELVEKMGRVSERRAGFWSRIKRIFTFSKQYHRLDFDTDFTNTRYQIKSIDFTAIENGAVIDILPTVQLLVGEPRPTTSEYLDSVNQQDAKRLILTDEIANKIMSADESDFNYSGMLSQAHPHAVHVINQATRQKMMTDYRLMHDIKKKPSFFRSCLKWIAEYFQTTFPIKLQPKPPQYQKKYELGDFGIQIRIDSKTQKVRLLERKPEITTFVFCGGGGRIFGHAGAARVAMSEYGVKPIDFAGSSCGAIMAACLYVGYTPDESGEIFRQFKEQDLVNLTTANRHGLSISTPLADKIKLYIRQKLLEYITEHSECFDRYPAKRVREAIEADEKITFGMVKKLKSYLPKQTGAKIGNSILVTSSNRTKLESVYYSTDKTPDEDFPGCVSRSANLPVVYQPVIDDEGDEHIDGGVMNNLPLNCFRDKSKSFIEHELNADTSVLAFQFDSDGNEEQVIHSERRIFQEGAVANFFYGLFTGISNPKKGWFAERVERRKYASQVILIDAKGISATNLDLPDAQRDKIFANGEEAARQYFSARRSKYSLSELKRMLEQDESDLPEGLTHTHIRMMLPVRENQEDSSYASRSTSPEDMIKDFENLEELLYYCAYRNRWDVFDSLCLEIESDEDYKSNEYLLAAMNNLRRERDGLTHDESMSLIGELSADCITVTPRNPYTHMAERYNQKWHSVLYPLLHTDGWRLLNEGVTSAVLRNDLALLNAQSEILKLNNASIVVQTLIEGLQSRENVCTHLFVYLLQKLLTYSKQISIESEALQSALLNLMLIVDKVHSFSFDKSKLIGRWSFNEGECLAIIESLHRDANCTVALSYISHQSQDDINRIEQGGQNIITPSVPHADLDGTVPLSAGVNSSSFQIQ